MTLEQVIESVDSLSLSEIHFLLNLLKEKLENEEKKSLINSTEIKTPVEKGWNPRFFEDVLGSWQGEPLVREEQPPYQEREALL